MLTNEFPLATVAVPAIVELGAFEGEPAWIVIEAYEGADGTLSSRRLWVFSRADLSVVAALSQP
jgi:hypothetical protein